MQQTEVVYPKISIQDTEILKEILMGAISEFVSRPCSFDTLKSIEASVHSRFVEFFQSRNVSVDILLGSAIEMVTLNKPLFYQFGVISLEAPKLMHEIFSGLSSGEVPIVVKWEEDTEEGLF